MEIKTFIIDAFTKLPFSGNPAGVCISEAPLALELMQNIAAELNLSETAFLVPDKTDSTHFSIRYFTPAVEVAFCGHASLASAWLVLQYLNRPRARFTTYYDLKLNAAPSDKAIKMLFPLYDTVACQPEQLLYEAFGITDPVAARFAEVPEMLLIEVQNKETLIGLQPDFALALKIATLVQVLIVTARSGDIDYDFYSRCFCPWIGIDEDPVTGAAHSVLAPYWKERLGKTAMRAFQASKRGGSLQLNIRDTEELEVTGHARLVLEGVIRV